MEPVWRDCPGREGSDTMPCEALLECPGCLAGEKRLWWWRGVGATLL